MGKLLRDAAADLAFHYVVISRGGKAAAANRKTSVPMRLVFATQIHGLSVCCGKTGYTRNMSGRMDFKNPVSHDFVARMGTPGDGNRPICKKSITQKERGAEVIRTPTKESCVIGWPGLADAA